MKYYATVAASSSMEDSQDTVEKIERRVLDSNPIMEAFGELSAAVCSLFKISSKERSLLLFFPLHVGNACTLRNNNSSRFGKYIQLQLDRYNYCIQSLQSFNCQIKRPGIKLWANPFG